MSLIHMHLRSRLWERRDPSAGLPSTAQTEYTVIRVLLQILKFGLSTSHLPRDKKFDLPP